MIAILTTMSIHISTSRLTFLHPNPIQSNHQHTITNQNKTKQKLLPHVRNVFYYTCCSFYIYILHHTHIVINILINIHMIFNNNNFLMIFYKLLQHHNTTRNLMSSPTISSNVLFASLEKSAFSHPKKKTHQSTSFQTTPNPVKLSLTKEKSTLLFSIHSMDHPTSMQVSQPEPSSESTNTMKTVSSMKNALEMSAQSKKHNVWQTLSSQEPTSLLLHTVFTHPPPSSY